MNPLICVQITAKKPNLSLSFNLVGYRSLKPTICVRAAAKKPFTTIAQKVEQTLDKRQVVGSNPAGGTITNPEEWQQPDNACHLKYTTGS